MIVCNYHGEDCPSVDCIGRDSDIIAPEPTMIEVEADTPFVGYPFDAEETHLMRRSLAHWRSNLEQKRSRGGLTPKSLVDLMSVARLQEALDDYYAMVDNA